MRKAILIGIGALALAAAAPLASGGTTSASKLVVAMHDPGCHWFYVGGGSGHRQFVKSITRTGPVRLTNLDEAALIVKGPKGTVKEKVGATLTLKAKGLYKITMVKQAADDNHLRLTIK
jgi:hypothetical protein